MGTSQIRQIGDYVEVSYGLDREIDKIKKLEFEKIDK